ncbi:hypothetical protein KC360_g114 [Hortaea werneckii]|nr:hypothetical protein KC344_g115 [Hortaea werneckii]KAI7180575.1 hypothetical protein KC360_g114 [Hortaea werneckii]
MVIGRATAWPRLVLLGRANVWRRKPAVQGRWIEKGQSSSQPACNAPPELALRSHGRTTVVRRWLSTNSAQTSPQATLDRLVTGLMSIVLLARCSAISDAARPAVDPEMAYV